MSDYIRSLDPSSGALVAAGIVLAGYLLTIEPVLFAMIDMNRMYSLFGGRNTPSPDEVKTYSYCGRAWIVGVAVAILILTNTNLVIDPFICMILCGAVCVPVAMGWRYLRDRGKSSS